MTKYLPKPNKTIKELRLLQAKPWKTWLTVWPFALAYASLAVFLFYPNIVLSDTFVDVWERYLWYGTLMSFPGLIFVHVFSSLMTVWSVSIKASLLFRTVGNVDAATHVMVSVHENRGETTVVPLLFDREEDNARYFLFQNRRWVWSAVKKEFCKPIFPTRLTVAAYRQMHGNPSSVTHLVKTFGQNKFTIHIPEFKELFVEHAMAPFFCVSDVVRCLVVPGRVLDVLCLHWRDARAFRVLRRPPAPAKHVHASTDERDAHGEDERTSRRTLGGAGQLRARAG
eukprot:PhM_4_TR8032/c0_g2_i1/m.41266